LFRIASWNIRVPFPIDDERGFSWDARKGYVAQAISRARPDVLGLQEDCYFANTELMTNLGLRNEYERYGLFNRNGEDGGTSRSLGRGIEGWPRNAFTNDSLRDGEHNSVWWRRDRFSLISNHTFWLSEFPRTPGTSFGEVTGRVVNCVLLNDRLYKDRKVLQFCSSHFPSDNVLGEKSTSVLKVEMDNIRREGLQSVDVAIVAGDFNSPPISATYRILSQVGWFIDARALALVPPKIVAVSGIPDSPANISTTAYYEAEDSLIDHIWIQRSEKVSTKGFPILVESVRHIPVQTACQPVLMLLISL